MIKNILSLLSGVLFAIGLSLSGMINPYKVKGFLNILGDWDYSLLWVMVGAIMVYACYFHLLKPKKPLCSHSYDLPQQSHIDRNLVLGAGIFGIGWGVAGICPAPAIVNIVTFDFKILWFLGSMITGMGLYKIICEKKLK